MGSGRLHFIPSRFIFLPLFLLALNASALDSDPIQSCQLTQKQAQQTLSQILESIKAIQALSPAPTEPQTCKPHKTPSTESLRSLQIYSLNHDPAKPEQIFDFANALWGESMRTMLLNRIDAEMRFQDQSHSKKNITELVEELCTSSDEGSNVCNDNPYSKTEKAALLQFGEKAMKLYSSTQMLTPEEIAEGISLHLRAHHADQPVHPQMIPADHLWVKKPMPLKTEPISDAEKKKETEFLNQNLNPNTPLGKKNLRLYQAVTPLLLTPSIASIIKNLTFQFDQNKLLSVSVIDAEKALGEYKSAIHTVTGYMGRDYQFAVHPNLFADEKTQLQEFKNKNSNPAWIYEMMKTHPAAITQLIIQHPEQRGVVCSLLKSANQSQAMSAAEEKVLDGAMYTTLLISGGLLVPDILGLELGTNATLATAVSVNGAAAETLFIGNTFNHTTQEFQLAQELKALQTGFIAQTGIRDQDVQSKKVDLNQNTVNLAWDSFFLAVPHLTKGVTLPAPVQQSIEKISQAFKVKPEQIKAGLTFLAHFCSMLDARCGAMMAVFHAKSQAEQEALLRDPQKLKNFENDFSKDLTPKPITLAENGVRIKEVREVLEKIKPGDALKFSDGNIFTVKKVLGGETSSQIFEINETTAIKVNKRYSDTGPRTVESMRKGYEQLKNDLPVAKILDPKSNSKEYVLVEKFNKKYSLDELYKKFTSKEVTLAEFQEKMVEFEKFVVKTKKYTKLEDFIPEQLIYDEKKGWILGDYGAENERYDGKSTATVFDGPEWTRYLNPAIVDHLKQIVFDARKSK